MSGGGSSRDVRRMLRNLKWAVREAFPPADLLDMAEDLLRLTEAGSNEWLYAQRQLAELLIEDNPWRAAVAARNVCRFDPDDDGAYALQALALTIMGHYGAAERAYRNALALSPDNPSYCHNLGHLLDVALGRSQEALPWLERAYQLQHHDDIASSFAHALGKLGQWRRGREVLQKSLGESEPTPDQQALLEWLERGAEADEQRA